MPGLRFLGETLPIRQLKGPELPAGMVVDREWFEIPTITRHKPTHFMTPAEREQHRIFVGPDGRLYQARNGAPFDTRGAKFVMDEYGNLYAGNTAMVTWHTSFLGGRTVTAAGILVVDNGRLTEWTDHSGHYEPRPEINDYVLDLLRRQGLVLDADFRRRAYHVTAGAGLDGDVRERVGEPERQAAEVDRRRRLLTAQDMALARWESRRGNTAAVVQKLQAERDRLAAEQQDLDEWSQLLRTGQVRPSHMLDLWSHPEPASDDDRIVPPSFPAALAGARTKIAGRDRTRQLANWWNEHGRQWWNDLLFSDLSPEYQHRLVTDFPALRNADGIPAAVRDTLNRSYVQLELRKPIDKAAPWSSARRRRRNAENMLANLYEAELEAGLVVEQSGVDVPQVYLLKFDPGAFGNRGGSIISYGDADTAESVSWHIPGAGTSIASMGRDLTSGIDQYVTAKRDNPNSTAAALVWADYKISAKSGGPSQLLRRKGLLPPDNSADRLRNALLTFGTAREMHSIDTSAHPIRVTGHGFGNLIAQRATHTSHESRHDTHQTSDGSTPLPSNAPRTLPDTRAPPAGSVNTCAESALGYAADGKPNTPIDPAQLGTVGLAGVTVTRFQAAAGADLQKFDNHQTIGDILRDNHQLGHGAMAVVVDAYHTTNESGIGAHAYILENHNGTIYVYEPTTGQRTLLDDHHPLNVRAITAILYRPDGRAYTDPNYPITGATHIGNVGIGADNSQSEGPSHTRDNDSPPHPLHSAGKRDRFGIDEFLATFDGAEYPPGTNLHFRTSDGAMRAIFGAHGVHVFWDTSGPAHATSEHTIEDFWRFLRSNYEALGITWVAAAQPRFQDSNTDRILDISDLRRVLTENSLDTETEIHFRDGDGHWVAVVRRDGNLAIREPQSDGEVPPETREIISRSEFDRRLGEYGLPYVRIGLPAPADWYHIPSSAGNSLFPTLAYILGLDVEAVQKKTAQDLQPDRGSEHITSEVLNDLWNNWESDHDVESALSAAARSNLLNFIFESPGKSRVDMTNNPEVPKFFLRHTDAGYEVGLTATGHLAAVVRPVALPPSQPRAAGIPKEQTPEPLTTMLAGGPEPLLDGAAMRRRYLPEQRPVSSRAPKPAVQKRRRTKNKNWIRNRTVPKDKLQGRNITSAHLRRPKIVHPTPVHYMDDVEREAYRLFVGPDGRLYNARDGLPFNAERNEKMIGAKGEYIFVMDEFGNLYAAEKIEGLIQHSSFFGGRTITAAGFISARDGIVTRIADSSGHYWPDEQMNDYAIAFLETQGLRFADDFQRFIAVDDTFEVRAPEEEARIRRAALNRAQRILTEGPTTTRPFKVYRTRLAYQLTWDHFPPGTTIGFRDDQFDATATVTDDRTLQVVARSIDGSQPDREHELDAEALQDLVLRLGVQDVRVERPEAPTYTYLGEDLLRQMERGEAEFTADGPTRPPVGRPALRSPHDGRRIELPETVRASHAPAADRPPLPMPSRWAPVGTAGDPRIAAIAQILNCSGAESVHQHIADYLGEMVITEHERREEVEEDRKAGYVDDTEWQGEQQERRTFDRWLANAYWTMADSAAHLNAPDLDAVDELLRLVSYAYDVNVVSVHPDGRVHETIESPERPAVFVRRTSNGHYEIGVTATGGPFVAWPQLRLWDELTSPTGRVPVDRIPEPLHRALAAPQIPLLAGAVPSKVSEPDFSIPVHYMDAGELESHRLFLGEDGRLYRASDGLRFDTTKRNDQAGGHRNVLFVMDEFGNLYAAATEASGRIQIASFLGEREGNRRRRDRGDRRPACRVDRCRPPGSTSPRAQRLRAGLATSPGPCARRRLRPARQRRALT